MSILHLHASLAAARHNTSEACLLPSPCTYGLLRLICLTACGAFIEHIRNPLQHKMEACPIRLFLRDGYFKTKIYKNREFYTNNIKNTVCASRLFHLRRPLAFIYMAMDTPSPTCPNKFRWIQYRSQSIEDGTNTPLLLVRWTIIERCCAKFLRRPTQGCWCRRQCQVLVS